MSEGLNLEGVSEPLIKALRDRGVTELTPVQEACLPLCLAGNDVMAKAKTGTGKTLGFCIPTCERLLRNRSAPKYELPEGIDPIRAMILSSTRELASQITVQAKQLLSHTDFNVEEITGGASIVNQRERMDPKIKGTAFKYGGAIDIMVATPGRVLEHIDSTEGFCERLLGLEVVVLDEVDMLLDGGFQRAIETIISKLPTDRQTLCFSATVPAKLLPVLTLAMREDHETVDCVGEEEVDTHALIEQAVLLHPLNQSLLALYQSIKDELTRRPDDYKIICFLPTARATQFYTAVLRNMGLDSVMEIHSRLSQSERTNASDKFRTTSQVVLLSSDVSARGVDYPNISLVLQVSAPTSKEQYVQRLGRTGRAGKSGTGLLLLCDYEKDFLKQVKDLPITKVPLPSLGASSSHTPESLLLLEEELERAAAMVEDDLATQTYRAWVMNAVAQRKSLKWSKEDTVTNANSFAFKVLGRSSVPPLNRDLVNMLGLKGMKGLNICDEADVEEKKAQKKEEEEEIVEEVVVKINKKEIGLGLMKNARGAVELIQALDDAAALELQAVMDEKGEAPLGDYIIKKDMVSVKKIQKTIKRSDSNSTLSSSMSGYTTGTSVGVISRNASAQSLGGGLSLGGTTPHGSAASLCSIGENDDNRI